MVDCKIGLSSFVRLSDFNKEETIMILKNIKNHPEIFTELEEGRSSFSLNKRTKNIIHKKDLEEVVNNNFFLNLKFSYQIKNQNYGYFSLNQKGTRIWNFIINVSPSEQTDISFYVMIEIMENSSGKILDSISTLDHYETIRIMNNKENILVRRGKLF